MQVDLHGQQVDEAIAKLEVHLKRLGELCHPGGILLQARRFRDPGRGKVCSIGGVGGGGRSASARRGAEGSWRMMRAWLRPCMPRVRGAPGLPTRQPVTAGAAAAGGDGGREAQCERHPRVAAGRDQVRRPRLNLVSTILGTVSLVRSPVWALAAVGVAVTAAKDWLSGSCCCYLHQNSESLDV